jgi:hypothetical protein
MTAFKPDRQRRDVFGETTVERGLPRGVLAVPRLDHVPHDALVHRLRIEARAGDRLAHYQCAEFSGFKALQRAEKFSGRGADGRDDDAFSHAQVRSPGACRCAGRRSWRGARRVNGA